MPLRICCVRHCLRMPELCRIVFGYDERLELDGPLLGSVKGPKYNDGAAREPIGRQVRSTRYDKFSGTGDAAGTTCFWKHLQVFDPFNDAPVNIDGG
jgi:hypothetical protein